jgi:hypothetical protein
VNSSHHDRWYSWRSLIRLSISLAVSISITWVLWQFVPNELSISTRITGYVTLNSFAYFRYRDAYYLLCFILPLLVFGFFLLAGWRGPLRKKRISEQSILPLSFVVREKELFPDAGEFPDVKDLRSDAPHKEIYEGRIRIHRGFWILCRMGVPALLIAMECSLLRIGDARISPWMLIPFFGYFLVVYCFACVIEKREFFGIRRSDHRDEGRFDALARANSLLAIGVLPLLYLASMGTTIYVVSQHHYVHYPWLPLWLIGIATLLSLALWAREVRHDGLGEDALRLESKYLTWLVGPVAVFLFTARIAGNGSGSLAASLSGNQMPAFWGFDDSHWLALPNLIFNHGLFPWRDVYVIHGLFQDVLAGQVGLSLFGYSWWGAWAGIGVLVIPLFWVMFYLFTAYFSRTNRLLLVSFVVGIVTGLLGGEFSLFSTRFIFLPPLFILFDQMLKKKNSGWTAGFMALAFVSFLLTPEMSLFVMCFLGAIVLFEFATRKKESSLRAKYPMTLGCGVTGVIFTMIWFVFLAVNNSLVAFLQFFPFFAFSRSLEVARALRWDPSTDSFVTFLFLVPVVLWLVTCWKVVAKVRQRKSWSPMDISMVAAALMAISFLTKAIDIPDAWHVVESFTVAIPLLVFWSVEVLELLDSWTQKILTGPRRGSHKLRSPHLVTASLTGIIIVGSLLLPFAIGNYEFPNSVKHAIMGVPSRFHGVNQTPASGRLGYTIPGSVDTSQINGLGQLLDLYAGPTAPVVDYSNEPGVTYFLLNRVPGSQFYIQEVAQTTPTQNKFISDLKTSRPPVVILNNTSFGYPNIDGVPDSIRSYSVSNYIFSHYSPLVNYQGQLLLLRNDLVASAPPLPPLPSGSTAVNVGISGPTCSLGSIPNFFTPPANSSMLPMVTAHVSLVSSSTGTTSGWAIDPRTSHAAGRVVAVSAAGKVVANVKTGGRRPDVAFIIRSGRARQSGFTMKLPNGTKESLTYYGLTKDGYAFLLVPHEGASTVNTVNLPSTIKVVGKTYRTFASFSSGEVEVSGTGLNRVFRIDVPSGVDLQSYPWLKISSQLGFEQSTFALSNSVSSDPGSEITFNTLRRNTKSVVVDVNACLQWHSYQATKPLFVRINDAPIGTPIGVTLIGGKAPS